MRALVIGYGSIGKRHFDIINQFKNIESTEVVTKQTLDKEITTYKALDEIEELSKYDYFVIASETVKHFEQLKFICSRVSNKKILVEKPLYHEKIDDLNISDNRIIIAYNLRFHPVLIKLRNIIQKEKVYFANIICGQYLPTWRPTQDYTKSYSASIKKGGGVLRDLSHEIDYISWLFGEIQNISAINTKVSDLEIESDDICTAVATTDKNVIINFTIDYISKLSIRKMLIHMESITLDVDMGKCEITIYDKNKNIEQVDLQVIDRNYTYMKMHEAILSGDYNTVCSFEEAMNVMNVIDNIKFKEL